MKLNYAGLYAKPYKIVARSCPMSILCTLIPQISICNKIFGEILYLIGYNSNTKFGIFQCNSKIFHYNFNNFCKLAPKQSYFSVKF